MNERNESLEFAAGASVDELLHGVECVVEEDEVRVVPGVEGGHGPAAQLAEVLPQHSVRSADGAVENSAVHHTWARVWG